MKKVWIVFTGEYSNYGSFGPAFSRKKDAEAFAKDCEGTVQEFDIHRAEAIGLNHYECNGWTFDPRPDNRWPDGLFPAFKGVAIEEIDLGGQACFLQERHWDSWDVLVPELTTRTTKWSSRHGRDNFVEADGRDRGAVREACIEALRTLVGAEK